MKVVVKLVYAKYHRSDLMMSNGGATWLHTNSKVALSTQRLLTRLPKGLESRNGYQCSCNIEWWGATRINKCSLSQLAAGLVIQLKLTQLAVLNKISSIIVWWHKWRDSAQKFIVKLQSAPNPPNSAAQKKPNQKEFLPKKTCVLSTVFISTPFRILSSE